MITWIVKTEEREYKFLFEKNADKFAEKLTKARIRVSKSRRFTPGDASDEEYWMRQDGKDHMYPTPV